MEPVNRRRRSGRLSSSSLLLVGSVLLMGGLLAATLLADEQPVDPGPEFAEPAPDRDPNCPHVEDPSDPALCAAAQAADSSLKMAATAEESYAVANNGAYTNEIADLEAEGWRADPDVILTIIQPNGGGEASSYCIEAEHASLPFTLRYTREAGDVDIGTCPV